MEHLTEFVTDAFDEAVDSYEEMVDVTMEAFTYGVEVVEDGVSALIRLASAEIQALVQATGDVIESLIQTIFEEVTQIVELRQEGQQDMVEAITQAVTTIMAYRADLQQAEKDAMQEDITASLQRAAAAVDAHVSQAVLVMQTVVNEKLPLIKATMASQLSQLLAAGTEALNDVKCVSAADESISYYDDINSEAFLGGDRQDCLCLKVHAYLLEPNSCLPLLTT